MKKKNYAAIAVALVTGGLSARAARAGLYSPTAVQNGGFSTDSVALPNYSYNQAIANWYRATGSEYWSTNNGTVSGASNNTYVNVKGNGSSAGEIFQSIGTFTANYNVSVSALEALAAGNTGHNLVVSLFSGGTPKYTGYSGYSGYGQGYYTYSLNNATLLSSKTIADDGTAAFNLSSVTLNTGSLGTAGSTLWLDITTDAATDSSTDLAVDDITATGATVFNLAKWKGTTNSTWDSSTPNFQTAGGSATAFVPGADVLFDDSVPSSKTTITLSGNVSPSTITFNNSSNTYTIMGSGSITGGTSVTMNGIGTTILATSNSFTGPVLMNAGTLVVQNGSALGTSQDVNVASGATLALQNTSGITLNIPVFTNGAGASGQGALLNIAGNNTIGGVLEMLGATTINVSSGSLTLASAVYGAGTLTKTGSGTLIFNDYNNFNGDTIANGGTIISNWYHTFIGTNLTVNAGAIVTATTGFVFECTNLNINGGTVNASASGGDAIGYGGAGFQVFNVNITNGGVFNDGANSNEGFDTAWNLTGGSITSTGGGSINFDVTGSSVTSNASATMSLISAPTRLRDDNGGGNLVFTVAQGTVPGGIDLEVSGNIAGGSDTGIDKEGPGTLALAGSNTYTGGVTVNGGTLMFGDGTSGHDGALATGNTITDNAAVVFDTYSAQSFGGSIQGSGSVTKTGPGTLTLSGNDSYNGATNVAAGKLYVSSAGSLGSGTGVTVGAGATLGGSGTVSEPVTVFSGGIIEAGIAGAGQLTVYGLSFTGTGTINISGLANYSSGSAVQVDGPLSTAGSNSVGLDISNLTGASTGIAYQLIVYSTESGPGVGSYTVSLPRGDMGTLSDTGSQIDLTLSSIGGSYFILWTGAGNAANGWDTSTMNWKYNGSPTAYIDSPGDPVVFDDTPGANQTVAIKSGDVHPASVTFNNSNYTYIITGPNAIAGAASLTVNGTGTVILENTNTFTGATLINSGTLQLGDGTSGHDGSISGVGGITDNGSLVFDDNGSETYSGVITGSGSVTKNGPGTLSLTGISNNSAATLSSLTVNSGTVVLGTLGGVTGTYSQEGYGTIIVNPGATLDTTQTHIFGYYGGFRPNIVVNGGTVSNVGPETYLGQITMTGGTITGTGNYRLQTTTSSPSFASVTTNASSGIATISIPELSLYGTSTVFNVSQGTVVSGIDLLVSSSIDEETGTNGVNGNLAKIGAGTMKLTGTNTYTGGTNVSGGTLIFASPTAFPAFSPLVLTGGTAVAANHGSAAKNNILASSLSFAGSTGAWTGLLDLTNNDMIVRGGSLANITNQVAEGYNAGGGNWQGSAGITTSTAAANTRHLTALGVITNDDGTNTNTPLYTTFDGTTTAEGDVLVKYTYYGDATLDGKVDGSDYSRIDNGYLMNLTGWFNGDFNYDGVINGSDYTLIDNSYNTQGALISAQVAGATAQIAGAGAVPEPATLGLLGMGAIGLLGRRRRR